MSDFIYSSKKNPQNNNKSQDPENQHFCLKDHAEFIDSDNNPRVDNENSDKVLAKKIIRDDSTYRFYIKLDNQGKLYNPLSIYGETKQSSFLDRVCRSQNKFKEVNEKAFNMYLSFLKTKNIAWFNNAEREA
jgi:hypothetical protein